mgnify:CR=1 FL=1
MINGTKFVVMFEKGKFLCTFRKMESVVEQYNRDLAEWEYQVSRKPTATAKEQHRPPEKESVQDRLKQLQAQGRQERKTREKSQDRER